MTWSDMFMVTKQVYACLTTDYARGTNIIWRTATMNNRAVMFFSKVQYR